MLARQFCEGDLLEPSQAMGGRGNQHQFVGREWLDNHGNLSRDGAHNRHVDAVLDERVDQRGTVQYVQGYLNFGKELAKLAQRFFELAHLGGDGRLAEMQLFGCTYVAAVPGDRLKCSKLMQVERAHAVAYTGSSLGNTYSTGIQYVLLYVSSDRRVKLK